MTPADDTPRDPLPFTEDDIAALREQYSDPSKIWPTASVLSPWTIARFLATLDARPSGDEALRELLREAVTAAHHTGSIRDHSDPTDKTGWNVKGIETCADSLCVDALAALAAPVSPSPETGMVFTFPDGTTGPGRWDPETGAIQKIAAPVSPSPDVEGLIAELSESPLPGARYAVSVVKRWAGESGS